LGSIIPGTSNSVGAVNYFQILLSGKNYLSIRNDLLNDPQGQRTGFATLYTSHTIGFVQYLTKLIYIRPEVRYEKAYTGNITPYDDGTRRHQFTASMDAIIRF
jgi:hypothetical protein